VLYFLVLVLLVALFVQTVVNETFLAAITQVGTSQKDIKTMSVDGENKKNIPQEQHVKHLL